MMWVNDRVAKFIMYIYIKNNGKKNYDKTTDVTQQSVATINIRFQNFFFFWEIYI